MLSPYPTFEYLADLTVPVQKSAWSISLTRQKVTGPTVARIVGDLDSGTVDEVRPLLTRLAELPGPGAFVLDLSGLTFLDASGLEVLLGFGRLLARRGQRPVLRATPAQALLVLKATGCLDRFDHDH